MRTALQRISATSLAVFIALADATVWLAAFPFLLYCRALVAAHHASTPFLLFILFVNALLVALMVSAVAATAELVRRGFTRPVRVPLRIPGRRPSARG
jgi:hypothetical protein